MGKTVPTYRNQLEAEVRELRPFRRALREGERVLFDSLINQARSHSAEGSFTAHPDPIVPFFLSILLEQERKIRDLLGKVDELVACVDGRGGRNDPGCDGNGGGREGSRAEEICSGNDSGQEADGKGNGGQRTNGDGSGWKRATDGDESNGAGE